MAGPPKAIVLPEPCQQAGQGGHRIEHVVGFAARVPQPARGLAGAHEHAGDAVPLRGEHIGLDVVADDDRFVRLGAQVCEGTREERLGRLPEHFGPCVGRVLQPRDERAAVKLQSLLRPPVGVAVHRDEPRSPLERGERLVERLVPELGAGSTDQHHLGVLRAFRRFQAGRVLADVAAVEEEAPAARELGSGRGRCGEHGVDVEKCRLAPSHASTIASPPLRCLPGARPICLPGRLTGRTADYSRRPHPVPGPAGTWSSGTRAWPQENRTPPVPSRPVGTARLGGLLIDLGNGVGTGGAPVLRSRSCLRGRLRSGADGSGVPGAGSRWSSAIGRGQGRRAAEVGPGAAGAHQQVGRGVDAAVLPAGRGESEGAVLDGLGVMAPGRPSHVFRTGAHPIRAPCWQAGRAAERAGSARGR